METFTPLSQVLIIFHAQSLLHGPFDVVPPLNKKTQTQHLVVDSKGNEHTYDIGIPKILRTLTERGMKIGVICPYLKKFYLDKFLALLHLDKYISYTFLYPDNTIVDNIKSIHKKTDIPYEDMLVVCRYKNQYSEVTETPIVTAILQLPEDGMLTMAHLESGLQTLKMKKTNVAFKVEHLTRNETSQISTPLILFHLDNLIAKGTFQVVVPPLSKTVWNQEILTDSKGQETTYYRMVPTVLETLKTQGVKIGIVYDEYTKSNLDEIITCLNFDKYISHRISAFLEDYSLPDNIKRVHEETGIPYWNMIYISPTPIRCYDRNYLKGQGVSACFMRPNVDINPKLIQNWCIEDLISMKKDGHRTLLPQLIVFALNDSCWPFFSFHSNELQEYAKLATPFLRNETNKRVFGKNGEEIKCNQELPFILETLRKDNVKIVIIMHRWRKNEVVNDIVRNLFTLFEFDRYISYRAKNDLDEPSEVACFMEIRLQFTIPYAEMLYFNIYDSSGDKKSAETLGVLTYRVTSAGLTTSTIHEGIKKFAELEEKNMISTEGAT